MIDLFFPIFIICNKDHLHRIMDYLSSGRDSSRMTEVLLEKVLLLYSECHCIIDFFHQCGGGGIRVVVSVCLSIRPWVHLYCLKAATTAHIDMTLLMDVHTINDDSEHVFWLICCLSRATIRSRFPLKPAVSNISFCFLRLCLTILESL